MLAGFYDVDILGAYSHILGLNQLQSPTGPFAKRGHEQRFTFALCSQQDSGIALPISVEVAVGDPETARTAGLDVSPDVEFILISSTGQSVIWISLAKRGGECRGHQRLAPVGGFRWLREGEKE